MSQQPAILPGSVGIKGSNTGGTAAYMAAQKMMEENDRRLAERNRKIQEINSFNEVFGYVSSSTQNYGFGQSFAHETSKEGIGNSCIHLLTFDNTDFSEQLRASKFLGNEISESNVTTIKSNMIRLVALLEELPELSFSFDFTEGPGNTSQDMIAKFFDQDIFGVAAAVGTNDSSFKNIINTGMLTNELWNGVKNSDIKLKFKIYTADKLGQTDPEVWIKALSFFATPYTGNQGSIRNYTRNIISGVINTAGIGKALFTSNDIMKDQNRKRANSQKPKVSQKSDLAQVLDRAYEVGQNLRDALAPVKGLATDISEILSSRYGIGRILGDFNINNCLGEKLWGLYLYNNFLFKRPLTVYIKDWSVKPSQETNLITFTNGSNETEYIRRPVYYQFELTCSLDQTYSIDQWSQILSDDIKLPAPTY